MKNFGKNWMKIRSASFWLGFPYGPIYSYWRRAPTATAPPSRNWKYHFLVFPDFGFPENGIPEIGFPEIGFPENGIPEIGIPEIGIPFYG